MWFVKSNLKEIFKNAVIQFENQLLVKFLSKKKNYENHIIMIGDTAGLIHPLLRKEWQWLFIVQNWHGKYNTFSRKQNKDRATLENI
jgi:hypothetical protein